MKQSIGYYQVLSHTILYLKHIEKFGGIIVYSGIKIMPNRNSIEYFDKIPLNGSTINHMKKCDKEHFYNELNRIITFIKSQVK